MIVGSKPHIVENEAGRLRFLCDHGDRILSVEWSTGVLNVNLWGPSGWTQFVVQGDEVEALARIVDAAKAK